MHPSTNASRSEFEMATLAPSPRNSQLYANLSQNQASSWLTWVSPNEREQASPRTAFVADHKRHELMRNGLLPRLDTMQLMHMQMESKRTKLELTPEEEEKRRTRREKNKIAAAKCRMKNREFSRNLQKDHEILEKEQLELNQQITGLKAEVERLEALLASHNCVLSEEQRVSIQERLQTVGGVESVGWPGDSQMEGIGSEVVETTLDAGSSQKRIESDAETIINSGVSSPSTEG